MPAAATLGLFVAATLALLLIPGPAVLYIVARSLHQGRIAGIVSTLGVGSGTMVHIGAAALGLSALLASSALAFSLVKYLGAAYLLYLGLRTLLAPAAPVATPSSRPLSLGRIYAQGVVVNILNPKTAIFFVAFLPQFVDPARGPVWQQILLLGAIFVLLGVLSDGMYALLAGTLRHWLQGSKTFLAAQRYLAGSVYLGLGVTTALTGGDLHP